MKQLFTRKPDERELYPELFRNRPPKITLGSIISQAILKTAILIIAIWFIFEQFDLLGYWWVALFLLWFLVVYPAFRQYEQYRQIEASVRKEIICATCRYYDPSGIICTLYDEHVGPNNIPCEGLAWEWRAPDDPE